VNKLYADSGHCISFYIAAIPRTNLSTFYQLQLYTVLVLLEKINNTAIMSNVTVMVNAIRRINGVIIRRARLILR